VKTIADTLGVARSKLAVQANNAEPARRRGRPAKPETEVLAEIKQMIADQPTYGYRRGARADPAASPRTRRCRSQGQFYGRFAPRWWSTKP
jgi:hypothetical protein